MFGIRDDEHSCVDRKVVIAPGVVVRSTHCSYMLFSGPNSQFNFCWTVSKFKPRT